MATATRLEMLVTPVNHEITPHTARHGGHEALDRLQILGTQSRVLRKAREQPGAKFLIVMEGEDDIGPSEAGERSV